MSSAYTEQDLREAIETLSEKFHAIYQAEAKRQGDVRHKDAYADLPENIKEFDRVLARFVLAEFARIRSEARAGMREACAGHFPTEWHGPISGVCACSCGWYSSLKIPIWADHILSLPDLAADEAIERIKREAQLEEARSLWNQDFGDAYNGGYLNERGRTLLQKRIAALSGKDPEQP